MGTFWFRLPVLVPKEGRPCGFWPPSVSLRSSRPLSREIYFFAGFYSVAGTVEDPGMVDWALMHVGQGVDRAARHGHAARFAQRSGNGADPGARAFAARGCVSCHGAPRADWAKFSEGINPQPADLEIRRARAKRDFLGGQERHSDDRDAGFGGIGVDDAEIWAITAFVKKLPIVSESDFKAWSAGRKSGG